jgi:hypothetical protein
MKDLKQFILEGQEKTKRTSVAAFYQWACYGEKPNGKLGTDKINPDDCQGLLDGGWFDNFDDSDPEKACKEIAKWFKDNWYKGITVTSQETPNDWEISFKLDGKEYTAAFEIYFGGDIDE